MTPKAMLYLVLAMCIVAGSLWARYSFRFDVLLALAAAFLAGAAFEQLLAGKR